MPPTVAFGRILQARRTLDARAQAEYAATVHILRTGPRRLVVARVALVGLRRVEVECGLGRLDPTIPRTAGSGPSGHVANPVSADAVDLRQDDLRVRRARARSYGLVGVQITKPLAPTWIDHVYSCHYVYRERRR